MGWVGGVFSRWEAVFGSKGKGSSCVDCALLQSNSLQRLSAFQNGANGRWDGRVLLRFRVRGEGLITVQTMGGRGRAKARTGPC